MNTITQEQLDAAARQADTPAGAQALYAKWQSKVAAPPATASTAPPSGQSPFAQGAAQFNQGVASPAAAAVRQQFPTSSAVGGSALATALHYLNTGTAGIAPKISAAVAAPATMAIQGVGPIDAYKRNIGQFQGMIDRSSESSPIGSAIGDVAGMMSSPMGEVSGAAANGATALSGLDALVTSTAGMGIAKRAAAGILQAGAGGTAAISAYNLLDQTQETYNVEDRIRQTLNEVVNPSNVALSVIAGTATGALLQKADKVALDAAGALEAKGFQASPDMLRQPGFLDRILDATARIPGGAGIVEKYRRTYIAEPLKQFTDDVIGLGANADKGQAAAVAAQAVRGLAGRLTEERLAAESPAYQAEKFNQISDQAVGALQQTITEHKAALQRLGAAVRPGTSDQLMQSISKVIDAARENGQNPTVEQMNELYMTARGLSNFKGLMASSQDAAESLRLRKVARDAFTVLRGAVGESGSQIDAGLQAGEMLRKVELAAQDSGGALDQRDQVSLAGLFRNPQILTVWNDAVKPYLTTPQVQAIRGYYLADLVDQTTTAKGVMSLPKLQQMIAKDPRYNPQVFDAIAPGAREELTRTAQLIDRSRLFKGEGSETAGRTAALDLMKNAIGTVAGPIAGLMLGEHFIGNPYGAAGALLGWGGTLAFTHSMLNGSAAARLKTLASGQPVPPSTIAARLSVLQSRFGGDQQGAPTQ